MCNQMLGVVLGIIGSRGVVPELWWTWFVVCHHSVYQILDRYFSLKYVTYIWFNATARLREGIHAGNCCSDRVSFGSQVLMDSLNWLISMQTFVPGHLIFINNFKATSHSISVDQCINHWDFAHSFSLHGECHHVILSMIEAKINNLFLSLLE